MVHFMSTIIRPERFAAPGNRLDTEKQLVLVIAERKRMVRHENLDKMLTTKEAAEILHVHPITLRQT